MNALNRSAVLLLIGGMLYFPVQSRDHAVRPSTAAACSTRAVPSRWAGRTYERVATYRPGDSDAFGWVVGVARVQTGGIAVYDAARSRVVIFGPGLSELRRFGRPGGGGGLAAIPHPISINGLQWIASDSVGFHVYTPDRIIQYDTSGQARSTTPVGLANIVYPIAMPGVTATRAGVVFYWMRQNADGSRQAESWLMRDDGKRMVARLPLPPLPRMRSGPFYGPAQARPLWRSHGDCLLVTDGASPRLLRVHIPTGQIDTLTLPVVGVPPPPDSLPRRSLASLSWARIVDPADQKQAVPPPSALMRWRSMVVDPDGWVWLEPRTSEEHVLNTVFRVDVASGAVAQDSVPAMPVVFGKAGTWYGLESLSPFGEQTIVEYRKAN